MKKRIVQIATLSVVVIVLVAALCACSFSGGTSNNGSSSKNVKVSGVFPTTEIPKWDATTHGEIFEYTEEADSDTGAKKVTITGLKEGKDPDKQLIIPDGVTEIASAAFSERYGIITLTIPDTVTSIGNGAFYDCRGLIAVSLGKNVTDIKNGAFSGCEKLVEVYNKSSLDIMERSSDYGNIGYYAKNVYAAADGTKLDVDDNKYVIYRDGAKNTLVGYIGTATELTLPGGVSEIYHYALCGNDTVTSVTIGSDVERTGDGAFAGCTALKNIFFGGKTTRISVGEFAGCTALTSFVIPETVTSIGREAFSGCTSLTDVTVGKKVTTIEDNAFSYCVRLVEVCNKSALDIKVWTDADTEDESEDASESKDGEESYYEYCQKYGGIGKYLKNVYKDGEKSKLTTDDAGFVIYTDGEEKTVVNYVGKDTKPVLPTGITALNSYAFYGCDQIAEIELPDGLTEIGESVFDGCDELKKMTIPMTAIDAIKGSSVKEVVITSGTELPDEAFLNCSNLTKVTLPDGLTSIGSNAFSGCKALTQFTIPDGVTSIGSMAFMGCTSLTSIIVPESVTSIGMLAFACVGYNWDEDTYETKLESIYYKGTEEQWSKIDDGKAKEEMEEMENDFYSKKVLYCYSEAIPSKEGNYWHYVDNKITVWTTVVHTHTYGDWEEKTPATCTTDKVERRVCKTCGNEETQTIEGTALGHNLEQHEAKAPTCTEVGWDAYERCTRSGCEYTTYVEKPVLDHDYDENDICKNCKEEKQTEAISFSFEYVKEQDGYTVTGYNGNEADVVIPKKYNDETNGEKAVTAIAARAFNNNVKLNSVIILDSMTRIGEYAFGECTALKSVTIKDGVKDIAKGAFYKCNRTYEYNNSRQREDYRRKRFL